MTRASMYPDQLDVRVVGPGKYRLLSRFRFICRENSAEICVPAGFETDFASIPRALRWLVDGHGNTRKPAVIHDYLYRWAIGDRIKADRIFLEAMEKAGVGFIKRTICYAGVRAGGWITWEKNRAKRN